MIKAGIIGATGYVGNELLRLLLRHPSVEVSGLRDVDSYEGKGYDSVYANYAEICNIKMTDQDTVIQNADVVFTCLPAGFSERIAINCLESGKMLIDLGSDMRIRDEDVNKEWYGIDRQRQDIIAQTVYSIPELHGQRLKSARIIANPGCYPTTAALALAPAVEQGLVDTKTIIIDSKSGVTGAGKGPTAETQYAEVNEAFRAYKIGQHRHIPEIEQILSDIAGSSVKVTFTPHLLPVNRGILSTVYAGLSSDLSQDELWDVYNDFYKDKRFVRILPQGMAANMKNVKYSNYCDISVHTDRRTGRLIVVSAIDNMVKGAAGQAIQNMNIALGLEESMGLDLIPPTF
ncbi:MAG: N-acetyl-gamma-glutamyl-phosphate reductase [Oscillospiraceae bacterium]|nr:N-acetyl-gamma-glutamyl-phosphate reductase [Oscillospiraceae bacterium]